MLFHSPEQSQTIEHWKLRRSSETRRYDTTNRKDQERGGVVVLALLRCSSSNVLAQCHHSSTYSPNVQYFEDCFSTLY